MPKIATIDFETEAVENRPNYPPAPVGVAVEYDRYRRYMAFGHPTQNNCTKREATDVLKKLWRDYHCVFHNAPFDVEIAIEHHGLRGFPRRGYDCTLLLAYLYDPRMRSLGLKPLAESLLGMPPDEQTKLREWILANVPEATTKTWGAYIAKAPGKLVGRYAVGDIVRTRKLRDYLLPVIEAEGMDHWYDYERRLYSTKLRMETGGIRVDTPRLIEEVPRWRDAQIALERKIARRLRAGSDFNCNSAKQLADAMEAAGKVDEWIMTAPSKTHPQGQRSTKRANLELVCNDKPLVTLLAMQGIINTYNNTFLGPWLERSRATDGLLLPTYNTVRSTDEYGGGKGFGTRTGRFSMSNPTLHNIPNSIEGAQQENALRALAKFLRNFDIDFIGIRDYFVPDPGCVFIGRDYSQQEVRILAHYTEGLLLQMYRRNPRIDIHQAVRDLVYEMRGKDYVRKMVKQAVFGLMYGMGAPALSQRINSTQEMARELKAAVLNVLPGVKDLNRELKLMASNGEPFYTWGGRRYYCEDPVTTKDGRTFRREYKMINTLIQGSAAECTKVGMIQAEDKFEYEGSRLVLQVHDELLACVPRDCVDEEMRAMKVGMEDVEFDLPMLTDGFVGEQTWARQRKYNDPE